MVTKISMRATMARMTEGEVMTIPLKLRGCNSVRNCAALLGRELGRKYSVSVDWEAGQSKVTRVS